MGIKKYSKEHKFVAYERSRDETNVIVGYCLNINAFFIEHLEDSMSTIAEREHRKNPPYECCDKEVDYYYEEFDYSDNNFQTIFD